MELHIFVREKLAPDQILAAKMSSRSCIQVSIPLLRDQLRKWRHAVPRCQHQMYDPKGRVSNTSAKKIIQNKISCILHSQTKHTAKNLSKWFKPVPPPMAAWTATTLSSRLASPIRASANTWVYDGMPPDDFFCFLCQCQTNAECKKIFRMVQERSAKDTVSLPRGYVERGNSVILVLCSLCIRVSPTLFSHGMN